MDSTTLPFDADLLFALGITCGIIAAMFFIWHSIMRDLTERAGDWMHWHRHRAEYVAQNRRAFQEMMRLQIQRMAADDFDPVAEPGEDEWALHSLIYEHRQCGRG